MQDKIELVRNEETMNEALGFLQNKLNVCINSIRHMDKEEQGELYIDFVEEEDELLRKVQAYHKLHFGQNEWKEEDIDRYFELTRKQEGPWQVVKVEHKEYGLRLADDNNLLEVLRKYKSIILSK